MRKSVVFLTFIFLRIVLFSQSNDNYLQSKNSMRLSHSNGNEKKNNLFDAEKLDSDSITDIDNNTYKIVQIGGQYWMAENLRVTHYRDGAEINLIAENETWANLKTGAYCWYNNDSLFKKTYGAIYNFYAVSNSQSICPIGWHVPTEVEWTMLINFLGGRNVAGGKLKEAGLTHWENPNICASNSSGFTALPGGYRIGNSGNFYDFGHTGFWWCSTEYNSEYSYIHYISNNNSALKSNFYIKKFGFSVRCVKDN